MAQDFMSSERKAGRESSGRRHHWYRQPTAKAIWLFDLDNTMIVFYITGTSTSVVYMPSLLTTNHRRVASVFALVNSLALFKVN